MSEAPLTALGPSALEGIRVVDLAGPVGCYCGKLFADLGAEVILVEPAGGAPWRRRPPLLADGDGESALFAYCSAGKRSVTADPDRAEDRPFLAALMASADLVIETEPPGRLAARGLSHAALAERNPALVTTSITPFGQTGPYAGFAASDLVCLALGGLLSLTGYADGPPVRVCAEQSYVMGSLYGAVAALMAVLHAEASGEGQHVDVSVQECVATALENAPQFYDLERVVRRRPSGMQRHAGTGVYACADGYVYLYVGGLASARFWTRLLDWLEEAGIAGVEQLRAPEWEDRRYLETDAARATFGAVFDAFARDRAKAELAAEAQERGIPMAPLNTAIDVAASRQLSARGFFAQALDGDDGGEGPPRAWPGAPYRLSATSWRRAGPPPAAGEDTEALRVELGFGAVQ